MRPASLADACDGHFPGDWPAVLPYDVQETGAGSLEASYLCPCGREWKCWWDAASAGWPAARRAAA